MCVLDSSSHCRTRDFVARQKNVRLLAVTKNAPHVLNFARLSIEFPQKARLLSEGGGIPAETDGTVVAEQMRIRLTLILTAVRLDPKPRNP